MSDVVNVEEDGPEIAAVEPAGGAPPLAVTEDPAPAAPSEEEPEGTTEVNGERLVPLAALKAERQQRQALQGRAAKADELEAYVRDSKPYVDFLRANPDLLKPRQPAPPAPTTFGAGPVDPEVEMVAKTLDLYTPDGKPDLQRAQAVVQLMDRKAAKASQQAVAPYHQQTAQDASARNYHAALGYKDPSGRSPSKEALTAIWRAMPAESSADPQVALVLTMTALGMDAASGGRRPVAVPPGAPPLVTEGQGGAPRRATLSALETAIARDRGVTDAKWQEQTKGFVPGRPSSFED